jgi:hypothetical protein
VIHLRKIEALAKREVARMCRSQDWLTHERTIAEIRVHDGRSSRHPAKARCLGLAALGQKYALGFAAVRRLIAPLPAVPRGRGRTRGDPCIRAGSSASGRVCASDAGCEPPNSASFPPHSGAATQRKNSHRFWLARPTLATRPLPLPSGLREFVAPYLPPETVRIAE